MAVGNREDDPEAMEFDRLQPEQGQRTASNKNTEDKPMSFDEALDCIGFGRMQICVLLVCGNILMTILTETMGMGLIMTAAHCDMELTSARKGIISSVTVFGILVSSQCWGFWADTRGRRPVILFAMFAANFFTLISSFSINFPMMVVTRFFTGVFICGASTVTYAYLGEFNSNRNRSTVIAAACIFVGASNLYLPIVGYGILSGSWSIQITQHLLFRPWRLLIIANTLPGFLSALFLSRMPESGKFLLSKGDEKGAIAVLQHIKAVNSGRSSTLLIEHLQPELSSQPKQSASNSYLQQFWQQTVPLFRRPLRTNFLVCCFLVFGVFFVSAGIGMWYPDIQNRVAHSNSTTDSTVCTVLESTVRHRAEQKLAANNQTIDSGNPFGPGCNDRISDNMFLDYCTLGTYYVIMYVFYAIGIRRFGLGIFLVVFMFVSGFAGLALQWVAQPAAVVVMFSSHLVFSGICVSILMGIVVILIPTEYRAMAVSISMMSGRLGSIVGSNLVGILLETNCSLTFFVYTGFIFVCGFVSLLLPIRKM